MDHSPKARPWQALAAQTNMRNFPNWVWNILLESQVSGWHFGIVLGAPFMKNPELHNIDKFNYLKSLLKRSAAATIAGLLLTDCNYNSAIELLTNLFGNEQVIISSHMGALLKLPFLGSTTDVRKLRQTYDEIEAHVRGLLALEVPTESYGSFLVPVLMSNNPEDIRLLVGREMKDLSEILRILRSEIENRERCGAVQALTAKENFYNPENRRNVKPPKSDLPSTSAFFSGNEPAVLQTATPHSKLSRRDKLGGKERMLEKARSMFYLSQEKPPC